jgi:hypothetical protein
MQEYACRMISSIQPEIGGMGKVDDETGRRDLEMVFADLPISGSTFNDIKMWYASDYGPNSYSGWFLYILFHLQVLFSGQLSLRVPLSQKIFGVLDRRFARCEKLLAFYQFIDYSHTHKFL